VPLYNEDSNAGHLTDAKAPHALIALLEALAAWTRQLHPTR